MFDFLNLDEEETSLAGVASGIFDFGGSFHEWSVFMEAADFCFMGVFVVAFTELKDMNHVLTLSLLENEDAFITIHDKITAFVIHAFTEFGTNVGGKTVKIAEPTLDEHWELGEFVSDNGGEIETFLATIGGVFNHKMGNIDFNGCGID